MKRILSTIFYLSLFGMLGINFYLYKSFTNLSTEFDDFKTKTSVKDEIPELTIKVPNKEPIPKKELSYKKEIKKNNCNLEEIQQNLFPMFGVHKIEHIGNYQPKIAVIDTGIDFYNKAFEKNIFLPQEFYKKNKLNFGLDTTKPQIGTEPFDTHGHGSHVVGLILSINPNAKILPIKYYNQNAGGDENLLSFKKALELAVQSNVDIINISGGGPEFDKEEFSIIKKALAKGILIVSAFGNEQSNIDLNPYYPAYYGLENILNVMSHDSNFKKSYFSNWGKIADISTFGNHIKSFGLSNEKCFYSINGTSQSTAIVSGVASLIKSFNPNLTYSDIKDIIKFTSKRNLDRNLANSLNLKEIIEILEKSQP